MRENCGQMNPLIKSITNDDIDTFLSIGSLNSIDVDNEKLKMTAFDSSAFCGSIKCFKYFFLEKVSISYETLSYAVQGEMLKSFIFLIKRRTTSLEQITQIYQLLSIIVTTSLIG